MEYYNTSHRYYLTPAARMLKIINITARNWNNLQKNRFFGWVLFQQVSKPRETLFKGIATIRKAKELYPPCFSIELP